jgi:hypothetical protein
VLYVHCGKCSRAGRYRVQHLIADRLAGRTHRRLPEKDCAQHERSMRRSLPS